MHSYPWIKKAAARSWKRPASEAQQCLAADPLSATSLRSFTPSGRLKAGVGRLKGAMGSGLVPCIDSADTGPPVSLYWQSHCPDRAKPRLA